VCVGNVAFGLSLVFTDLSPEKTLSKHLLSLTDTSVMPLGVRLLFETFWLLCDQDSKL
jgi:hypothetical protein